MTDRDEKGVVVWLTGISASGKTTIARAALRDLRSRSRDSCLLDSDELRPILAPDAGYDETGREQFYQSLGQLAVLLAKQGLVVLVAATASRRRFRDAVRANADRFLEVFVDCDLATCKQRDPKGLYARADKGELQDLPGAQAPYEPPLRPELVIDASSQTAEESARAVVAAIEGTS